MYFSLFFWGKNHEKRPKFGIKNATCSVNDLQDGIPYKYIKALLIPRPLL